MTQASPYKRPAIAALDLNAIEFEQIGRYGRPWARLLATIEIGGVYHHLEAVAVREHPEHGQLAVSLDCEELLTDAYRLTGQDSAMQTVRIGRHDYVLLMTPYSH
jgi:hypothetical protein